MTSTREDACRVAEQLQGQCLRGVGDVCEDLGIEDTVELRREIDGEVFRCSECDWWCEACEENDAEGGVCLDCMPELEEEDDD